MSAEITIPASARAALPATPGWEAPEPSDAHASCVACRGALDALDVCHERDCPHCGAALDGYEEPDTSSAAKHLISVREAQILVCDFGDGDVAGMDGPYPIHMVGSSSLLVWNAREGWALLVDRGSEDERVLLDRIETDRAIVARLRGDA